jgi:hypothetical protein
VGRKWRLEPDGPDGSPWFSADGAASEPHLVEPPIRMVPTVYSPSGTG